MPSSRRVVSWSACDCGHYNWAISSTLSSSYTAKYRFRAVIDDYPPRS
jgi:hypothetical protein